MTDIYKWSKTAADNDDADSGINWAEFQNPDTVNNSARTMMKRVADWRDDLMPTRTATGSGGAYTVTANGVPTSFSSDFVVWFRANHMNPGASTLVVNSLPPKPLRARSATALKEGEIQPNTIVGAYYSAATDEYLTINTGHHVNALAPQIASSYAVGLQVGMTADYYGSTLPPGFLWCDGSAVSRTTYAQLFAAIGTQFGAGDGVTTFNLPDRRGRGSFGRDNMGGTAANRITAAECGIDGTVLGANGGDDAVTIPRSALPNQTLTVSGNTQQAGSKTTNLFWSESGADGGTADRLTGLSASSGDSAVTLQTANNHVHAINIESESMNGGVTQTRLNNMPPAIVCNVIILALPAAANAAALGTNGLPYRFNASTTAADPAAGFLALNNAAPASATALYISETGANSEALGGWLATFGASTSTIKGQVYIYAVGAVGTCAIYDVTAAPTDNGAWRTVPLAYVGGSGTFTSGMNLSVVFWRNGDVGEGVELIIDLTEAVTDAQAAAATATTQAGIASSSATLSQAARDAALGAHNVFPTTAAAMGNGVQGATAIVGGSGGTNGTFPLITSGGTQVNPVRGYFVVAGGAVTSIVVLHPGYYTSNPSGFDFSASSGLTGASATPVMGVNRGVGEVFSVPQSSGDASIIYRVDSGPTATEISRVPSASVVGGTQTIGPGSIVGTGSNGFANFTVIRPTDILSSGYVTGIDIGVDAIGTCYLVVASLVSGTTYNLVSETPFNVVPGLNSVPLSVPVAAGQRVGVRFGPNVRFQNSVNPEGLAFHFVAGAISTSTVTTNSSLHRLEFAITATSGLVAGVEVNRQGVARADADITAIGTLLGVETLIGTNPDNAAGLSTSPTETWFVADPLPAAGSVVSLEIASASAQTVKVVAVTLNGDGSLTKVYETSVAIAAGDNTVVVEGSEILAGKYVGVYAPSGMKYKATTGTQPTWRVTGEVTTSTAKTAYAAGVIELQTRITVRSGVALEAKLLDVRVDALESGVASNEWSGKKWAALGSSIVADDSWTSDVAADLNLTLENLGVSGATLVSDGDIWDSIASIDSDADLVTLTDLINDFASGVPLGSLPSAPVSGDTSTFYNALYSAVVAIRAQAPGAVIVLGTMYGAGTGATEINIRNGFATGGGSTRLWQWQQAVRDIAQLTGVHLADVAREAGIGYSNHTLFTTDGLHLNATGGARYRNYMTRHISGIKAL